MVFSQKKVLSVLNVIQGYSLILANNCNDAWTSIYTSTRDGIYSQLDPMSCAGDFFCTSMRLEDIWLLGFTTVLFIPSSSGGKICELATYLDFGEAETRAYVFSCFSSLWWQSPLWDLSDIQIWLWLKGVWPAPSLSVAMNLCTCGHVLPFTHGHSPKAGNTTAHAYN